MFKSNARAACICGVRNFCASSSIRAFSSALYGRPGRGGQRQLQCLVAAQRRANQIALLAAQPEQQHAPHR